MGNTVSQQASRMGTLWLCFTAWAGFVVLLVVKTIIVKLWGSARQHRRNIDRCKKRRDEAFADWKRAVASTDEGVLDRYRRISSLPFPELRDALQSDSYTAVEVLEAFIWKALQVNERINCCIEPVAEAFDIARLLDAKYHNMPNKPPLYGVPFSVKGNFFLKGYDCTIGIAKLLDQPKDEECSFVTMLKKLGGVPFVLTNIPQGLLSFVCSNPIYGTTCNPLDPTRSPGGSSGGEAALLAGGGSPFGIGSDLAGSLRIPATFCGLVSLKPTEGRFVVTGSHGGVPGKGRIGLSFGFFTKTVDEQVELLNMTMGTADYHQITPISPICPLDVEKTKGKTALRIGYFDDDGFYAPVPSMRRAVLDTVEKLRQSGHTLERFKVPNIDSAATLFYKLLFPDGGSYIRSLYENDIVDPYFKQFVTLLKIPRCLRWIVSKLIGRISPQAAIICAAYVSDLEDLRYSQELVDEYRKEFISYWKGMGIDALVCPSFPVAAVPHEYPARLSAVGCSTGLFNMIDFPAGVVPAGHVTKEDDSKLNDEKEFRCGSNFLCRLQRDASQVSVGLPSSVQIVTLPFEEEMCLRVMKEVEQLWKQ